MTTPDEAQALLPVMPEDRHEAWPFVPRNSIAGQDSQGFFDGKYDDCQAVQAFAHHRQSHSLPGDVGTAIEEAQFLCDRLDELDWSMSFDDFGNNYNGHVDPSHSRLKGFLAALTSSALSDLQRLGQEFDDGSLGRFGHHPEPAIDFECEVEQIESIVADLEKGMRQGDPVPMERIARAMTFLVGGDPSAVAAKATLRELEKRASALSGDAGEGEPWPGCYADLQQRRVTTLAKLGLMLSVMASGEAAEVVGYDAAELYAEVLMALAIEDADDTDIALEAARDEPDGDILMRAGK